MVSVFSAVYYGVNRSLTDPVKKLKLWWSYRLGFEIAITVLSHIQDKLAATPPIYPFVANFMLCLKNVTPQHSLYLHQWLDELHEQGLHFEWALATVKYSHTFSGLNETHTFAFYCILLKETLPYDGHSYAATFKHPRTRQTKHEPHRARLG